MRIKEGKRKDIFSGEGRIKGKLRGRRWYRDPGKKNNSLQRHNYFIFLCKHMHGVLSTILIVPIKCFVSGKVKKLTIRFSCKGNLDSLLTVMCMKYTERQIRQKRMVLHNISEFVKYLRFNFTATKIQCSGFICHCFSIFFPLIL